MAITDLALSILCIAALAIMAVQTAQAQTEDGFTDHGVAAAVSSSRGAVATVDGDGNRLLLVWLSDYQACRSMLVVDVATGETEQVSFERPAHDSPFAFVLSSRNRYYSQFADRFYEFDPLTRTFTFVGQTPSRCAMSMTEAPDGVIWAGLYPESSIVSFDPDSGELTAYPKLNEENWAQYPSSIAVDDAGWVYIGIGNTEGQVVGLHPPSGETRKYIAEDQRTLGAGRVFRGTDGQVYATGPGWSWHILSNGDAAALNAEKPPVNPMPIKAASWQQVFPDFPDGSKIEELNIPERYLELKETDGTVREVTFDYESEGCHVMSIQLGPDNTLYGSTGHPLRVYHFDPQSGQMAHNGLLGDMGHLNAMTVQGELIYGAQYGGGILHCYDPAMPWQDRHPDTPNPRRLGAAQPEINRPAALLAHPDGRHLIMAGTPGYGRTGGGLYIYDLETNTGEVLAHEQLLENLSTCALVALPDGNLVGSTTVHPGTGGETRATEAELYMFDMASRTVVWREAILPGRDWLTDLLLGPDGLIYGIAADSTFFAFDPATKALVHEEMLAETYGPPAGSQAPRIMLNGPDGNIYVLFQRSIVRVEPGSFEHMKLADSPVPIHAGLVWLDGSIYFSNGSHLWSYKVPGL